MLLQHGAPRDCTEGNRKDMINGLAIAVALGLIFTVFQAYEYQHAALGSLETSMARTSLWRLVSTAST